MQNRDELGEGHVVTTLRSDSDTGRPSMVHARKPANGQTKPAEPLIPEDEQWRLVNESGILKKIKDIPPEDTDEGLPPLAEEIFNAIVLIMPMSFLLLLMEM